MWVLLFMFVFIVLVGAAMPPTHLMIMCRPRNRRSPMRHTIGCDNIKDGAIARRYSYREWMESNGQPTGKLVKWDKNLREFVDVAEENNYD